MIPNNITKDHIIRAIRYIQENGIPAHRRATKYLLKHGGKCYPPKYVISIANKYANGIELDPEKFKGGKRTIEYLEDMGFILINKKAHIGIVPAVKPLNEKTNESIVREDLPITERDNLSISVKNLFKNANLVIGGSTKWGGIIKSNNLGVYVIALTEPMAEAPISIATLEKWIMKVKTMKINNRKGNCISLKNRLSEFWLPNHTVLYIGKTDRQLNQRLQEFYEHQLGDSSPHRGGHWLKTLSILDSLNIYWAETDRPVEKESEMLDIFLQTLQPNNTHMYPFANLKGPRGVKQHGIKSSTIKSDDEIKYMFPYPDPWYDIFKILNSYNKERLKQFNPGPPMPLILAAWSSPNSCKHKRWISLLEWAESNNCLNIIERALEKLEYYPLHRYEYLC